MSKEPIHRRSWEEFRAAGLLWWVNRILHLFGWCLVVDLEGDTNSKVKQVYPARTAYRGFDLHTEDEGFKALSQHVFENRDMFQSEGKKSISSGL